AESLGAREASGARGTAARERAMEHGGRPSPGPACIRARRAVHPGRRWRDARVRAGVADAARNPAVPPSDPGAVREAALGTRPPVAPLFRAKAVLGQSPPTPVARS